ncbi:MAG TPA: type II toxin-antitoxin system RelE/ParE family toxin [Cyanothece sp. UBA12306]|nr:type II toxin-antitoxin system RelE/ParE family toxin [Cyanothece sp. UBA12306]
MYKVVLTKKAKAFYSKTDPILAKKLARSFEILEQTPSLHPNIKALTGKLKGYYRYRIGDYRIIYQIDHTTIQVIVIKIAHRSKIYDKEK